jgi:hypothetical protein
MKNRRLALDKERTLRIDKDCFVDKDWIQDYVGMAIMTCRLKGVKVLRIQKSRTSKGFHFYIDIAPPAEAELANRLQWLLGDDCGRVDRNRARIRSGLKGWNKLFERPNPRLVAIRESTENASALTSIRCKPLPDPGQASTTTISDYLPSEREGA